MPFTFGTPATAQTQTAPKATNFRFGSDAAARRMIRQDESSPAVSVDETRTAPQAAPVRTSNFALPSIDRQQSAPVSPAAINTRFTYGAQSPAAVHTASPSPAAPKEEPESTDSSNTAAEPQKAQPARRIRTISRIFARSSAVEFTTGALNLFREKEDGNAVDMNGRVQMNLFSFQNGRQDTFIPFYLKFSAFYALHHYVMSERFYMELNQARQEQQRYPKPLRTFHSGSTSGQYRQNGQSIAPGELKAVQLDLLPAKRENSVLLVATVFPGVRGETGIVTPARNAKPYASVNVCVDVDEWIGSMEMTKQVVDGALRAQSAAD